MIVKYSKKFPYAPYLNEDIGFEIEIDESYGGAKGVSLEDMVLETLAALKSMAEKFFKESNPRIGEPIVPTGPDAYWLSKYSDKAPSETFPTSTKPPIDYKAIEKLEIAIDNAESLVELETYKDEADKHGLGGHYDARLLNFKHGNHL